MIFNFEQMKCNKELKIIAIPKCHVICLTINKSQDSELGMCRMLFCRIPDPDSSLPDTGQERMITGYRIITG
jgi:hypothetical protein